MVTICVICESIHHVASNCHVCGARRHGKNVDKLFNYWNREMKRARGIPRYDHLTVDEYVAKLAPRLGNDGEIHLSERAH